MADKPLNSNPVADLPENWVYGQTVAPNGADVGLSEQHGYNYLMRKQNEALRDLGAINDAFSGVASLGSNGKLPVSQLPEIEAENVSYDNTGSGLQSETVQGAIDELKTSVSSGKALIAAAVTDKGVETAATDSFAVMAGNIQAIRTAKTRYGNGPGQISSYELDTCGRGNADYQRFTV